MKNKIIPIILIFIMSLSSSVLAAEIDNISLEEAKQIKNMATLEYVRKGDSYGKYWTEKVTDVQFQNYWNGNIKNAINNSWYKDFVNNDDWSWDKSNFTVMYGNTGQFYIMYTGKLKIAETDTTVTYIDGLRPGSTNYLIANTNQFDTYNMTKTYTKNNDGTLTQTNIGGAFSNTRYQAIITVKSDGTIYNKTGRYGAEVYGYFEQTDDEEKFSNHCLYSFTEPKNIYLYPKGQSYFKEGLLYNELPKDTTSNENTSNTPDYSYTVEDNGIFPEIYTNYYNGYVPKNTTKPDYFLDEYYNGENYYNVQFKIKIDQNAIYDWSTTKIILGIYELKNIDGQIKPKLHEYMEADAMAVYESGDNHLGFDIYTYDLFNIWNRNGNIDTHINAYGIDNIGFALHLYDDKNGHLQSKTNLLMFTTEYINDNPNINDNINSDINFGENTDFWVLLENTKQFLNKFLSFFNIFPMWLNTLIATAVTVAIICRIIGR